MEPLNALTPNTAAFFDSLGFADLDQKATTNPTAFPPSAFFPVPGRDTPEESSPSSAGGKQKDRSYSLSDSDQELNTAAPTTHKRKAQGRPSTDAAIDDTNDGGAYIMSTLCL